MPEPKLTHAEWSTLNRRLNALEDVVTDFLRENGHQLTGGEAFVRDAIGRIADAREDADD